MCHLWILNCVSVVLAQDACEPLKWLEGTALPCVKRQHRCNLRKLCVLLFQICRRLCFCECQTCCGNHAGERCSLPQDAIWISVHVLALYSWQQLQYTSWAGLKLLLTRVQLIIISWNNSRELSCMWKCWEIHREATIYDHDVSPICGLCCSRVHTLWQTLMTLKSLTIITEGRTENPDFAT